MSWLYLEVRGHTIEKDALGSSDSDIVARRAHDLGYIGVKQSNLLDLL